MTAIRKYPRTRHIHGSQLQPGDHDLTAADFADIAGRHLVVEEKVDGANAAISFTDRGELRLQSRGHYLTGGARERHFALFKSWAHGLSAELHAALGHRYVLYGEWLYAKHTIYYDALPHYFLEFDVLDRVTDRFLSTPVRRELLRGLPLCSVPVLHEGTLPSIDTLTCLIGPSAFKSHLWRDRLTIAAERPPHRPEIVARQTDASDLMEGLYIKVEDAGRVEARFKFVRHDFLTAVLDADSHWQSRPILPNRLAAPVPGLTDARP